ncbi:Putative potassium transporter 12 [Linum perenne]
MGTSPLYVFTDVFSKVPIESEVDVLGALSTVMYTIALIPLAKYVFVVLKANDNGEGGTFALYSLISRYAKVNMLPNHQPSDEKISSFKLKLPTPELERALSIKELLETRSFLKTVLLLLVLMGTSMVIGDGILTPAISANLLMPLFLHTAVMSATSGLQGEVSGFGTNAVVAVSIVILLALFGIQRFGTGKVGIMFAPVLGLWFFSLGAVGVYNLVAYDISVLRALNPAYIYFFFQKNGVDAWSALGGCVLCITGAEAMFADLGHFSVKAIQIAFTFVVFPCLLLAYLGQAAFLMKHPESASRVFYDSVPESLFWPVFIIATLAAMIASQAMISATFSCVKQSMALGCFPRLKIIHTSKRRMGQIYIPVINYFLMTMCIIVVAIFRSTTSIANAYGIAEVGVMLVTTILVTLVMLLIWQTNLALALLFPLVFGSIELIYLSAVLSKLLEGGWLPLAFASFFLCVMYIWNYGSVLKYRSEVREKISMDLMHDLTSDLGGPSLGIVRVRGIGIIHTELVSGIPAIFSHFVTNLPAFHQVLVFLCVKSVPVPHVRPEERFLVGHIGPREYRMYRCIVRYGYRDIQKDGAEFEDDLVCSVAEFIRRGTTKSCNNDPSKEDYDDDKMKVVGTCSTHNDGIRMSEENIDKIEPAETSGPTNQLKKRVRFIVPMSPEVDKGVRDELRELMEAREAGIAYRVRFIVPMSPEVDKGVRDELRELMEAREAGIAYIVGHSHVRAKQGSGMLKKLVMNYGYEFLRRNSRGPMYGLSVPHASTLEVGMVYNV